jgi:hypothetical protein
MKPKTLLIILLVAVAITGCDRKHVNTPPMFAGEEFDQGEKAGGLGLLHRVVRFSLSTLHPHE